MNSIVLTLIPVASIGIDFFFNYVAWKSYSSTKNISNWEVAQGTITKSNVKSAGAAFIPDIEYQYFVVGVEYKGTVVTVLPDIIFDVKAAQGLIEEYPVGKRVEVFYNPEIHRVAVLERESSTSVLWVLWLIVGTALAFLIFGFAFLFQ